MIDTASANKIRKMTDSELERQESTAYNAAYGEAFGNDHEARADAYQWHRMLAREIERRRALK